MLTNQLIFEVRKHIWAKHILKEYSTIKFVPKKVYKIASWKLTEYQTQIQATKGESINRLTATQKMKFILSYLTLASIMVMAMQAAGEGTGQGTTSGPLNTTIILQNPNPFHILGNADVRHQIKHRGNFAPAKPIKVPEYCVSKLSR